MKLRTAIFVMLVALGLTPCLEAQVGNNMGVVNPNTAG